MLRPTLILITALAMLSAAQLVPAASFTVTDWFLGVQILGGGDPSESSSDVQNPYEETQFISAGVSTAEAVYSLGWNDSFGRFLIEGSLQAEDARVSAESSGLIFFETTVDLRYDIDIAYAYSLPGGQMSGGLTYNLLDFETHESFSGGSYHDNTWTAGPVSDAFAIQASGILPAGREYIFRYKLELDTSSFTGLLATGSGHVDLTLTAVPEPASLAPLAILAPLVFRHRRST